MGLGMTDGRIDGGFDGHLPLNSHVQGPFRLEANGPGDYTRSG